MPPELLTMKQVMEYLQVSRTTVSRLMRQGLPHIKLDRRVLFRKADIDRWLESKIVK